MNYKNIFPVVLTILALAVTTTTAQAATSPNLGNANSFSILSSTYTNTVGGTTIGGDLGYTTGPATTPTVNGSTYTGGTKYTDAGIDQNSTLAALNSQPCTFTFAPGPINLASDTTHGTIGVYTPGVYCMTGASAIGGGGTIKLTGGGTYIFRIDGALTTTAGSIVTLAGGASACDVWWTPTQATTLGANSTFVGTDIDAAGITIGSTVTWTGQALAFGGTVSTDSDTINTPTCSGRSGIITSSINNSSTTTNTSSNSVNNSSTTTPGLPNTGLSPLQGNDNTIEAILAIMVLALLATYGYLIFKRNQSTN